jgi:RNA polymerase sigma-70 factor (ECF subfamily)
MDLPPRPDPETLARLRDGIRIMALRALGSIDAAEEVAQETLARALSALESGRLGNPHSLSAYVHGIARHVIADVHRSSKRTLPLGPDDWAAPAPSEPDALDGLVSAEQLGRVRAALADLSPEDRELLRLCFFEGLTPSQIAKSRGMPAPTVRKRKSRALKRLRRIFFTGSHAKEGPTTNDQEMAIWERDDSVVNGASDDRRRPG